MHTGLDRLLTDDALREDLLRGRVGLLAHPASVTRDLVHAAQALRAKGVRFEIIFGPEHGYGGEAQDMIGVADAKDTHGTPIRSLYGEHFEDLSPRAEDLDRIDVLLVDLQDIGARYYTFIWTAVLAVRACVARGVRVVVLDRPNPLGHERRTLEGRAQLPRYRSFVGLEPIAVRHSLTLGQIVAWRAAEEGLDTKLLSVVASSHDEAALATSWDRPFVPPSPNMPTPETTVVYPGGCLLEGTNLSDGRGTTRPFEITGAPYVDGERLARELNGVGLPGFVARALTFRPTFHKHAGLTCGGVQVHVTDPSHFRSVATYVALITLAHHHSPAAFAFRTEKYEFVDDVPAFDLLTGDAEAREAIVRGVAAAEVAERVSNLRAGDAELWDRAREASLLLTR
ncbi:MAG TPA: DUF1343 domain-containing protein [Polyangiaceae bacterium]